MKELKRFQGSTFDAISRKKLIEDRNTILELTIKIQEQNKIKFMNDSKDFKMLNQFAMDIPTLHVNLCWIQLRLPENLVRKKLNPWSSDTSKPIHSSTAKKNENQTPVQNQRCQSGPSAKNSVIFISTTSHTSNVCFDENKTKECTCSKFPTEAMMDQRNGDG